MNPVLTNMAKTFLDKIRRRLRGSTAKQHPHSSPFAENSNLGSLDSNTDSKSSTCNPRERVDVNHSGIAEGVSWLKPFSLLKNRLPFAKPTLPKWFGTSLNGSSWFGSKKAAVGSSVFKTVSIEQRRAIQASALLNSVKVKRNDLTEEGTEVLTIRKPSKKSAPSPFANHEVNSEPGIKQDWMTASSDQLR